MDPKKFLEKPKKVAGTTKVDVVLMDFLDSDYETEILSNQSTISTGLLEVVRLNPKKPNLPTFIFRWDERPGELDVDICNCPEVEKQDFKMGKRGYKGHHTQEITGEGKIFVADIGIPNKEIFKGKINVGLFIQLMIKDSGVGTDSVKVVNVVKIGDSGVGTDSVNKIEK